MVSQYLYHSILTFSLLLNPVHPHLSLWIPLKSLLDHKSVKPEAKFLSVVTQGAPPIPGVAFINPPLSQDCRVFSSNSEPTGTTTFPTLHFPPTQDPTVFSPDKILGDPEMTNSAVSSLEKLVSSKKGRGRCPCSLCPSTYSRHTVCLLLPVVPRLKPVRGGLSLSCP